MVVILENIQSIEKATYDLPDTGFVKIGGGNSNGKSILVKTIGAINSLRILDLEVRRALIRRGTDVGKITIEHKGKILMIQLFEDRNSCFVCLQRANGEQIMRTFRDGGIKELLEEFGFRNYNKNSICLQVYETFGPMPFINTSGAVGGEIVEAVTEDSVAKEFLENFHTITYPRANELKKQVDQRIEADKRVKDSLLVFKYQAYEDIAERMRKVMKVLDYLIPFELAELNIPPVVHFIDLPRIELSELRLPINSKMIDIKPPTLVEIQFLKVAPIVTELEDISSSLEDMTTILNGKCPTCGRPLIEKG